MNTEMKCYIIADVGLYDTVYVYKPPCDNNINFFTLKTINENTLINYYHEDESN